MNVITRFPPSPTGYLHVGGARTALFNWLFARKHNGEFILRIEDTDLERSTKEAEQAIFDGLEWLGLDWDQGPFYQSKRFDRYRTFIDRLLEQGKAYYCSCDRERLERIREEQKQAGLKPRYDRCCRDLNIDPEDFPATVIRFRNPLDDVVIFADEVRGRVSVANSELDDLIIARSDGSPTYNFTVVVDDIDMRVSHVIRGDDHINNTPRQINLFKALQAPLPVFAHVPMILGPDGQKLSKRHGAVSVTEYDRIGILPEAMLNYLVRLGWSHGDREIFQLDEMIELFDIKAVNKSAASFDPNKLHWMNQTYIKQADSKYLSDQLQQRLAKAGITTDSGPALKEVAEALRERALTLEEMAERAVYFYQDFDEFDPAASKKHLRPVAAPLLKAIRSLFEQLENWQVDSIHAAIKELSVSENVNMAKIAQPLRVAISGIAATPSIDITVKLVGRERTLARIDRALEAIGRRVANAS